MNFSKGLLGVAVTAALLADTPSAHAATWATSNLNSSNMVVAYSPDYPNQVANAAAYWNNLAGTTVVGVTTDPSAASVTIKDVPVPDGDNTPNLALTFAPTGETDIYQQRITEQGADLQTVITHELGHSLGLDHDPASTLMAPSNGHLGGQAHDYQALKADLASHGREIDNPAFDGQQTSQAASSAAPASSAASASPEASTASSASETSSHTTTSQTARATRDEASTQAKQLATVETTPDQPKTFDAKVSTIAHNTTKRIVEGAMVVVGAVAGLFTAMARYSRTHID